MCVCVRVEVEASHQSAGHRHTEEFLVNSRWAFFYSSLFDRNKDCPVVLSCTAPPVSLHSGPSDPE